jgi:DNA-directed RNA polymerase II subunit RPB1
MHKLGGSTYHHASFEETQDVLINAAAFGTHDKISGVTENLMMGMLMPGGTGCCDVISLPRAASADDGASAESAVHVRPMTFASPVAVEPMFDACRFVAPLGGAVAPVGGVVAPLFEPQQHAHPAARHKARAGFSTPHADYSTPSSNAVAGVNPSQNSSAGYHSSATSTGGTTTTHNRRGTNFINSTARSLLQFVPLSPSNITITKEFRPLSPRNI